MGFSIDYTAAAILIGALALIQILKNKLFPSRISPSFKFSRLADIYLVSWRARLASFPDKLCIAALVFLMVAFIDPHFLFLKSTMLNPGNKPVKEIPTEGIALYLVLDRSGSMAEPVETVNAKGDKEMIPKIDLLKRVTKEFILSHPSDLIGLVSFARVPRVLVPLTLDRDTLLKQLDKIQVAENMDEDGTAMGYAIYKTTNLLSTTRQYANMPSQQDGLPYTIKSAVIIVVTDGFQDPNRLDQGNRLRTLEIDDAAIYAKSQDVRLYVVNIDPAMSTSQYAPQRRQLQKITALTGGQFYLANESQGPQEIYAAINKLEKGSIKQEAASQKIDSKSAYTRFSLYPYLLAAALILLFLSLFLKSTLFRVVP